MVTEQHRDPPSQSIQPGHMSPSLEVEATGIVDRVEDLAAISSLLMADEVRLLTLTGPAGVGKTRLAREVGRTVAPHFPQGVVFVDLTPVRDPALILPTLAANLGVPGSGVQLSVTRLEAYLADREMLLILDNLEQVLPADVGLEELLSAAPHLVLLVTSREPLHLLWEQLYHVPPLALPDPEHLPPLEQLAQIPSVALFLRRARMIDSGFRLTAENAGAVAELMVHLDGLPLAIKLAAARTQILSPRMLLERLSQRLSLLHWEAQDLPARQHTLRAALAWSYDLLPLQKQIMFRRLSVFIGGFTLDAAEAVAGPEQQSTEVLEVLGSLVDKSLVQHEHDGQGGYRFRMLESVREFALEQLTEAGELDAARWSHAHYYLALAERAEPELTGPGQRAWFLTLEATQDNLRAALEWLLDRDENDLALRLSVALAHFWEIRGHLAEGRRWLEAVLIRSSTAAPSLRARALTWLGGILVMSVDRAGPSDAAAHAEAVLTEGMSLAQAEGDAASAARALMFLGVLTLQTGEWQRGRIVLQKARTCLEEAGHHRETIQAVLPLGMIAFLQGEHDEAMQLFDEILSRHREVGDDWGESVALLFSMSLMEARGTFPRAVALGYELLVRSEQSQSSRIQHVAAAGVAWLLRRQGPPERLACLVGAAEAILQARGLVASLIDRLYLTPTMEALQGRMSQEDLDAARRSGRHLSFKDVAALIRELLEGAHSTAADGKRQPESNHAGLLSPRELEVLQLVAEGFSNKQIARELIIAESTVRYHLTSVFNKLGVDTRTHALAVAAHRGLIDLG